MSVNDICGNSQNCQPIDIDEPSSPDIFIDKSKHSYSFFKTGNVLSDKDIIEYRDNKNIFIEPFNIKNVKSSSYDITLGTNFFREVDNNSDYYNIYSYESVHNSWVLNSAPEAGTIFSNYMMGINASDKIIVLNPQETILAHSEEFIGGINNITTMMKTRSSMRRNYIDVCGSAGWGDVGYFNRWTMEITNFHKQKKIILVCGRRIAQIVFFPTGFVTDKYTGKYQENNISFEDLATKWSPYSMIPKLWLD